MAAPSGAAFSFPRSIGALLFSQPRLELYFIKIVQIVVAIQDHLRPDQPLRPTIAPGTPRAKTREMIIGFTELKPSATKTALCTRSLPSARVIHFWFCVLYGAATLATSDLASQPEPDDMAPETTAKTSGGPLVKGIDLSSSAGDPQIQNFADIKEQGYRYVIVCGWGGVNRNGHAQIQLNRARNAGLLIAGYCYLNFASDCDGGSQVCEALAAFDTEAAYLGFLAIDVETEAATQLSPGLQREPPHASAQQQAVARIAEAVQQVQRVGLRAVIYTKKSYWKRATGNTTAFNHIPLWWTQVGPPTLSEPDLTSPSWTFGGWTNYVGKQCVLDTTLTPSGIPVDLDIFDASAFASSNPNYKPLPHEPDNVRLAVNR